MMQIRKSQERGHAQHGWLDSRHTFSFASYYDPQHMGFRALRVINDDRVMAGAGFPTHPHRDMEILSYVVDGALEHKDSMGNGSVIRPGELQRMSAGSGVTHSEYNHSKHEPVRFLQIWLLPDTQGSEPGYEQKMFGDERRGALRLLASREGREGSLRIQQDVNLYASVLDEGQAVEAVLPEGRYGWLQVVRGEVRVNGERLLEGDGLAMSEVEQVRVSSAKPAEFLFFDLA